MNESENGTVRPQSRRILIIFNPIAGSRRKTFLNAVLAVLERQGCGVILQETKGRGDAEDLARAAARAGEWDVIAVAGGDGTVNEAANGLYGSDVPLAIIPMGTANVLAAEIGLPATPQIVAETIASGPAKPIHLGIVNQRLFTMMAGAGFDGRVVAAVSSRLKRWLGKGAFVLTSLWGILRYSNTVYRVTVDGREFEAASVIVANGHYYGGRFTCAPMARLEEPLLYTCLFLKPGPWRALRYCTWLVLGRLHRLPDVAILPSTQVSVDGRAGEPVQGDGDIIAETPMTARLAEGTLKVLMPC
jgi:YegS/Rv2252/BmrU family lipid kinase